MEKTSVFGGGKGGGGGRLHMFNAVKLEQQFSCLTYNLHSTLTYQLLTKQILV